MIKINDGVASTKTITLSLAGAPGTEGKISARVNRLPNGSYQSILIGIVVTVDPDWDHIRDALRVAGAEGIPEVAPKGPLVVQQSSIGEAAERRRP